MTDSILASQTDICVKCGLCLPHCPTYLKTQDENESPRGRLSLIQGWANDQLEASDALIGHVDQCVLCRACESVCPAYVPYGQIVDRFRAATHGQGQTQSGLSRLRKAAISSALTSPSLSPVVGRLMAGSAAGAMKTLAGLAGAGKLTQGLPTPCPTPLPEPGHYLPEQTPTGAVSLFLGCTADLADRETVASAIRLLHRLGVRVDIPTGQTCCGALHQHAGETVAAGEQIQHNLAAFGKSPADEATHPIISFASGCGAMLSEYGQTSAANDAQGFARRVRDISQFLAEHPWPDDLPLMPLSKTVCIHSPCSLKNVLRADRHAATLLKRIPELNIVTLPAQTRCCGAGGSYMVDHPDMAAELRDDVLAQIVRLKPDLLVTSNPGCAMHLRAGLRQQGLTELEVVHPVTLLARQLL